MLRIKRNIIVRLSILAAVAALTLTSHVSAQELSKEDVKKLALEAILENPEIIMQAIDILRAQESDDKASAQQQAYIDNEELLKTDANAPVLGNPDGDVTIVEFFDYNCGYCKRAMVAMQAVLTADKNLRVVYREFPILSDASVFASRAALASREQGKYEEFHWALMSAQTADEASVLTIAAQVGLDVAKLRVDMDAPAVLEHIQTSRELADALQFTGTPSFIIGDEIVGGYIPQDVMEEVIADARAG
jgi:protein-disulfide isomerase